MLEFNEDASVGSASTSFSTRTHKRVQPKHILSKNGPKMFNPTQAMTGMRNHQFCM